MAPPRFSSGRLRATGLLVALICSPGQAAAQEHAAPPAAAPVAAPGPRVAVDYMDFGPSVADEAGPALRDWVRRLRAEEGALDALLLREIGRPERFAVVETWRDEMALAAHQASGASIGNGAAAGLSAPPDERVGAAFNIAPVRAAGPETPAGPLPAGALYVLIHVDTAPFNLDPVNAWLISQAKAGRAEPGALRYEVWRQIDRLNHFTVIQVWANRRAYDHHIESPTTRAFRANLLIFKGALYDERLYQAVEARKTRPP